MDSVGSGLFTIFVDNLPEDVGISWFRKFFNQYGIVKDAYIPIKRSKVSKRRFGFVRYNCLSSAEVAISKANGFWIDDRKLFVKWAAFEVQRNKPPQNKVEKVLFNGNGAKSCELKNAVGFGSSFASSFADVVARRNQSKPVRPSVNVSVDGNKWLDRSAVGWLPSPRSLDSLREGFIADGVTNIQLRDMGGNLVLLTFISLEEMSSMLEESGLCWLRNWFDDVKKWSPDLKLVFKREVWLSCYGIPLHLWNADTFFNIGNTWGDAITLDDSTSLGSSFSVGKVKILTNVFETINEEISLVFNNNSYLVRVVEEQGVVINSLKAINRHAPDLHPVDNDGDDDEVEIDKDNEMEDSNAVVDTKVDDPDNLTKGIENEKADSCNKSMGRGDESNFDVDDDRFSEPDSIGCKSDDSLSNCDSLMGDSREDIDSFKDAVATRQLENTMEYVVEVANTEDGANRKSEESTSHSVANQIPIQTAIKGIKGKRNRKSINEILGYNRVKFGENKGKGNKKKCVVLRSAVASAALSASISSGDINNRNRILLDEAQAIWAVNKIFGLGYDGDENEVISKIAEMEALNKARADDNL